MNLRDALQVWRRRWILTLLLVLVALAVSAAAATKAPRHYSAESDVVLLPSASSTANTGHNPYLTYNGALPMTAQILSYQLTDPQTVQSLAARGYTASFTATVAPNTAGAPILSILVTGGNKKIVENTLHGVTNEVGTTLSTLQSGIAPVNRITILTLSVANNPSLSTSKTARPVVIVLAFGLALALAIPLVVDGASRRRNPIVNGTAPRRIVEPDEGARGRILDKNSDQASLSKYQPSDDTIVLSGIRNVHRQISGEADPVLGQDSSPVSGISSQR
jgi:capsular polysaccharide biosynthesis protein